MLRKMSKLLPHHSNTAVLICDIQERFRSSIVNYDSMIYNASRMVHAANELSMPVFVSEQYPKAFGNTVGELKQIMEQNKDTLQVRNFEQKSLFSMVTPQFVHELQKMKNIQHFILTGIEAHVCILQTTVDLFELGYNVNLAHDAISASSLYEKDIALKRLSQLDGSSAQNGSNRVTVSTTDSLLFQLVRDAKHENFKAISNLVKEGLEKKQKSQSSEQSKM
ncbi:hypothetical protein MP228_012789 [Amoeboaphelidium protococcarum]|nr:hypothetical protein MP228_012789 [Amoeboaphelidium protococcarum]